MRFCIPSYRRPACKTLDRYPDCAVYVDPSDEDAYRAEHPDAEIVVLPDGVQGNVARVRNWILDHVGGPVVLLDDDIDVIGHMVPDHEGRGIYRKIPLSMGELDAVADQMAECCHGWGFRMFGCNTTWQYVSYAMNVPFSTHAFVGGPFQGFVPNPLRYDESLPLKEDYDMVCQQVARYQGVLRYNMMYYSCDQGCKGNAQRGGCTLERNTAEEAREMDALVAKWGKWIRRPKGRDINPTLRIPIKGL